MGLRQPQTVSIPVFVDDIPLGEVASGAADDETESNFASGDGKPDANAVADDERTDKEAR